jgi:hypothetical protein
MRSKWPDGPGIAGSSREKAGTGDSEQEISEREEESREEQVRRSRPVRGAQADEDGGPGDYVGGGREVREASWMKRARLRSRERVSPIREALAELFKPK